MKQSFFFFSLVFFHSFIFSQKITSITWVGTSNEYLKISKFAVSFNNGNERQRFSVVQYAENNYIILSKTGFVNNQNEKKQEEQKYNIIRFTKDTLILAPQGNDILNLCKTNEQNQYIFVNSKQFPPQPIQFTSLYFETKPDLLYVKIAMFIDSTKHSRILIHDSFNAKETEIKSVVATKDYNRLISILARYDISRFPEDYFYDVDDIQCRNSFFEIKYNGQVKRCRGCTLFPFNYSKLETFIRDHIGIRVGAIGAAPTIEY